MKRFFTNWKTSLGAVIVAVGTFGPYTGLINHEQANLIMGVGATFGLIKAKDNNVTGGTKVDPKDVTGVAVNPQQKAFKDHQE